MGVLALLPTLSPRREYAHSRPALRQQETQVRLVRTLIGARLCRRTAAKSFQISIPFRRLSGTKCPQTLPLSSTPLLCDSPAVKKCETNNQRQTLSLTPRFSGVFQRTRRQINCFDSFRHAPTTSNSVTYFNVIGNLR